MAADLFSLYVNKRNAPYIIWTCLALVFGLILWFSRTSEKPGSGSTQSKSSAPRSGKRRTVSVCLDGIVLGLSAHAADAAAAVFLQLCSSCEVFAIAQVQDEQAEAEATKALESMGAFDAGLKRHRLMFCSTAAGRGSMVRQLQPDIHLEAAATVREALDGKVREVRLLGSSEFPTLQEGANF
eukprot:TRINITY_DN36297_c0_g1_i1.p1 TRINITY_DN36297_c0_g1~~TRINITY_DN36297_c0_g1_i1.p1  ORF type:complete len:191 (+),score=40.01 TRINITY_DN36297_c0_g1_i1:26-574(+)